MVEWCGYKADPPVAYWMQWQVRAGKLKSRREDETDIGHHQLFSDETTQASNWHFLDPPLFVFE